MPFLKSRKVKKIIDVYDSPKLRAKILQKMITYTVTYWQVCDFKVWQGKFTFLPQ